MRFSTANGPTYCTETVWIKVPHLGLRRFYVVEDCTPLISVTEDIQDYGNVFYWDASGPVIETREGKVIRLDVHPFGRLPYLPMSAGIAQADKETDNATEA